MKVLFTPRIYVLASMLMLLSLLSANAQQAKKISLQGFLKDANGKAVADGQQAITFKLYTQDAGGTAEWTEDQTVNVFGGVYSTHLGKTMPLKNLNWGASTYYVGVTVQGTELTPRTELTFAPYSLGSPKAQEVVCSGAVGDIKHSILNPEQFAQVNGNCWVPMDGRNLATTDKLRRITGRTSVPDGSGLFIRNQEFSNSPNDPDRNSNSPIAQFQDQAMQRHQHSLSGSTTNTNGAHVHGMDFRFNGAADPVGSGAVAVNGMTGYVNIFNHPNILTERNSTNVKFAAEDRNATNYVQVGFDTGNAGSHSHSLSGNTGNNDGYTSDETRPKNMNFWVYIRIN